MISILEQHVDGSWWYHPGETFDNDVTAFCLYHPDGRHGGTLCNNDDDAIKVVGNRYDNPELIKVKKL